MTDPLVNATDIGTYLNDVSIQVPRAEMMILDAQILCESVVNPLPDTAAPIVKRIAARAYVSTTTNRNQQLAAGGSPIGGMGGGVWLSHTDIADLRRLAGGGGAFMVDTLPPDYVAPLLPWWDQGSQPGYSGWDWP